MDLFSHALLPYLLGNFFKRNKKEITAFVLGGIAPDFDVFLVWINSFYPTFFLIVHRGITHTLFFGFFTALAVLYLATREKVRSRVQKFISLETSFSKRTAVFAYAGVLVHLFLDYVTTRGVPVFYPFETARYSAEVFFYTDIYLTILSLIFIILLYKKYVQKEAATKILIIFLVVFAVLGALRLTEKNSAENAIQDPGIKLYPTMSPFDWYAVGQDAGNIRIYEFNGTLRYNETFSRMTVISQGEALDDALLRAGELPQVKMFKWRAYAVAVNASFDNGSWLIEYYDPLQRKMLRGTFFAFRRAVADFGSVKVRVEKEKAFVY